MKNLITASLAIAITLFSYSAMAQLKGPAFKNGSISEKYQGNSKVNVSTDPGSIKGPEAKNNRLAAFEKSEPVVTASLNDSNVTATKKSYKTVDLKASETKHDKGLKGPKFKNHKLGK